MVDFDSREAQIISRAPFSNARRKTRALSGSQLALSEAMTVQPKHRAKRGKTLKGMSRYKAGR